MTVEEQFDKIIMDALAKATQVTCPLEEFAESLRCWKSPTGPIQEEIDAAEEGL